MIKVFANGMVHNALIYFFFRIFVVGNEMFAVTFFQWWQGVSFKLLYFVANVMEQNSSMACCYYLYRDCILPYIKFPYSFPASAGI